MNAEILIKKIKGYLESEPEFAEKELIITPTKYDPTKLQKEVSFIILEKVVDGSIPIFEITVEDLQKYNK